jgi:hypothetical protein
MMKRSLLEELCIRIDKEELAQLLGADPGFSVQNVEEQNGEFLFLLSRETALEDASPSPQRTDSPREQGERKRFF